MIRDSALVSVIIPFLNEQRFLAEAIESVLNQSYSNWELLLMDDGSTDESANISKSYIEKLTDKSIFYIEHPGHLNRGLSASRNYAIKHAKGELLAFLDADDIWLSNKLEDQVSIMQNNPQASLLCEAAQYWFYADSRKPDVVKQVGNEQDRLFFPPELIFRLYPLSAGQAPCPSGLMARKSAVERIGGFEEHFNGRYQMYEDQGFLQKMYLQEPVYISSQCHHRYRQRKGSLVHKVKAEGSYKRVREYFLNWLERYVIENKIEFPEVTKLLKSQLEKYRRPYVSFIKSGLRLLRLIS